MKGRRASRLAQGRAAEHQGTTGEGRAKEKAQGVDGSTGDTTRRGDEPVKFQLTVKPKVGWVLLCWIPTRGDILISFVVVIADV